MKKNGFAPLIIILIIAILGVIVYLYRQNTINKHLAIGEIIVTNETLSRTGTNFAIKVNIQNNTSKAVNISPGDFTLYNTSDQNVGKILEKGGETPSITTISLSPGNTIIGYVTFSDIPENFKEGTLRFQPELSGLKATELPIDFNVPLSM